MEEEIFIQNEADVLTQRIVNRLGERQHKLMMMKEWEHSSKVARIRPVYYLAAVAACIVIVLLITPLWKSPASPWDELDIEAPSMTAYRAATPEMTEVAKLMELKKYDLAIVKVEKILEHSDIMVKELRGIGNLDDEALLYEEEAEWTKNGELRWTYIYLLLHLEQNAKAKKQLKLYLMNPFSEHQKEARALLKALK